MDESEQTDNGSAGAVSAEVDVPAEDAETAPVETPEAGGTAEVVDSTVIPEIVGITDPDALKRAASLLGEGECVVLPTDTVYGIAADALDPIAVQRLLMAKGRGRDMPPPVLIGDAGVLPALCDRVPESAQALADAYWPGGLTLIFHAQQDLRMDLGETNGTIAVRVPDQDAVRDLLRLTGPLAVSSANKSGRPPALSAQDAADQLGTSVALYLAGGPSPIGEPSTIIDFVSNDQGRVLRQGALSLEEIHRIAPDVVAWEDPAASDDEQGDEPGGEQDGEPDGRSAEGLADDAPAEAVEKTPADIPGDLPRQPDDESSTTDEKSGTAD